MDYTAQSESQPDNTLYRVNRELRRGGVKIVNRLLQRHFHVAFGGMDTKSYQLVVHRPALAGLQVAN